jgi:hypothetical protein
MEGWECIWKDGENERFLVSLKVLCFVLVLLLFVVRENENPADMVFVGFRPWSTSAWETGFWLTSACGRFRRIDVFWVCWTVDMLTQCELCLNLDNPLPGIETSHLEVDQIKCGLPKSSNTGRHGSSEAWNWSWFLFVTSPD